MSYFKACNQDFYPLWMPEWVEMVSNIFYSKKYEIKESISYFVFRDLEINIFKICKYIHFKRNIYLDAVLNMMNDIAIVLKNFDSNIKNFEEYKKMKNLKFICERQLNLLE